MEKQLLNNLISVDSETGEYWQGQIKLVTASEVTSIINQAVAAKEMARNFTQRGKSFFHHAAVEVAQTVRSCFGSYCLLHV